MLEVRDTEEQFSRYLAVFGDLVNTQPNGDLDHSTQLLFLDSSTATALPTPSGATLAAESTNSASSQLLLNSTLVFHFS